MLNNEQGDYTLELFVYKTDANFTEMRLPYVGITFTNAITYDTYRHDCISHHEIIDFQTNDSLQLEHGGSSCPNFIVRSVWDHR